MMCCQLLFLVVIITSIHTRVCAGSGLADDCEALAQLMTISTDAAQLLNWDSLITSGDPTWCCADTTSNFIGCQERNSSTRITHIVLDSLGISGNLNGLEHIHYLEYFTGFDNYLTGSLEIFQPLKYLDHLIMFNNFFTGNLSAISESLYSSALIVLALDHNFLTGTLDPITNLKNLQVLRLHSNDLTGDLSGLSGLTELYQLSLSTNRLTGTLSPLNALVLTRIKPDSSSTAHRL